MTGTTAGERTVLVGIAVYPVDRRVVEEHLDELARLVETAGGEVVDRLVQERSAPDPATVVGAGFVDEIGDRCEAFEARSVVFDEDLTGSQVRNLERQLPEDVKVLDRAGVILDIFALRARSREARTQVELAQLSYLLPRLTRRWQHLSRQAGGIGTRGVGETQLEIDRRLVSHRISQLKTELRSIEANRRLRRERRERTTSLALVGYTNAGKSSLFRRLTGTSVLVEDRLFATLDPRARRVALGEGVVAVLTDTVGFIRKLPHDLVAPFRSTLEEAALAEIVLHVVDVSHPAWEDHLRVGGEVLDDLDVPGDRVQVVLNKVDRVTGPRPALPGAVAVSAVTGAGIPGMLATIRRRLLDRDGVLTVSVPLADPLAVQTALELPGQVAHRFDAERLLVALVASREELPPELCDYQLEAWPNPG